MLNATANDGGPMPQPNDLRRSLLAGEARRLAVQRGRSEKETIFC